jgi:hypothetical protein
MYENEEQFKRYVSRKKVIFQDTFDYCRSYIGLEVNMGRYIPDIVLVLFKEYPVKGIIPRNWTLKHSFVLYYVRKRGPISAKEVSDLCYSDLRSVEKILESMKDSGMVNRREDGYEAAKELSSWKSDIVAVELKMKRWGRAVRQAERYKEFADSVHVVMPNEGAQNAMDNLMSFREKGVGLSVVHEGRERAVLPGVAEPPDDPRHHHLQVSSLLGHTPNWLRYESNASSHT